MGNARPRLSQFEIWANATHVFAFSCNFPFIWGMVASHCRKRALKGLLALKLPHFPKARRKKLRKKRKKCSFPPHPKSSVRAPACLPLSIGNMPAKTMIRCGRCEGTFLSAAGKATHRCRKGVPSSRVVHKTREPQEASILLPFVWHFASHGIRSAKAWEENKP